MTTPVPKPLCRLGSKLTMLRSLSIDRQVARVAFVIGFAFEIDVHRPIQRRGRLRELLRHAGTQLERRVRRIDQRAALARVFLRQQAVARNLA